MSETALIPHEIAQRIVSPAAYAEWNEINANFTFLRRELPFAKACADGYDPFWVATKYDDIQEISRKPEIFPSNGYRVLLSSKADFSKIEASGAPYLRALITMDAPEHWAFRRLVFRDFAPAGVKRLEESFRDIAIRSIGQFLASGGTCDFVETLGLRYPLRVVLSLLGIPSGDEDRIMLFTQQFFNAQDPAINRTGEEVPDSEATVLDLDLLRENQKYFYAFIDKLRAEPCDTVASKIANGRIDGELISHWDAMSQIVAAVTAGHDTTSTATANAVWALAERPELFERVRANPTLIPKLVDEAVRWASPLLNFMRTAAEDYEIRGQTVRKGDWIMLSYLSANRDEDVFDNPYEFSLERRENVQLGFGHGPHLCLGRHVALLEMKVLFEELFRRVTSLEMAGSPIRQRHASLSGINVLPIRFTYN
jgi:cytochrome P450